MKQLYRSLWMDRSTDLASLKVALAFTVNPWQAWHWNRLRLLLDR